MNDYEYLHFGNPRFDAVKFGAVSNRYHKFCYGIRGEIAAKQSFVPVRDKGLTASL
jgi:hypothetical protein